MSESLNRLLANLHAETDPVLRAVEQLLGQTPLRLTL
jgi:hypothetical protein